jgi:hypothetical protein
VEFLNEDGQHRLSDLITKLGIPYERVRDVVDELSDSLQALEIERIAETLPLVNENTHRNALRMKGRLLGVCNDYDPFQLAAGQWFSTLASTRTLRSG